MLEVIGKCNALFSEEPIFFLCAVTGSGMFIIQFILSLFGIDNHEAVDGVSGEIEVGQFKWLSKQAITGFLMMFGWIGLTCKREFGLAGISSALLASMGGGIAIVLSASIFKIARKLCSSGSVFNIEEVIGKEATTYQRIPEGGTGKIIVSLNQFTYEIEAMSIAKDDIPSFSPVRIIKKADEKTVIVIPTK